VTSFSGRLKVDVDTYRRSKSAEITAIVEDIAVCVSGCRCTLHVSRVDGQHTACIIVGGAAPDKHARQSNIIALVVQPSRDIARILSFASRRMAKLAGPSL
jgi:hypothetical protein